MSNLAEKGKVLAFPIGEVLQEKEVVVADVKDGYTGIPHAMMDLVCRTRFSDQESRIFHSIVRQTYGWHKSEDWIVLEQFVEMTGMKKPNVSKTIKSLVARKIIHKKGSKFSINPIISEWIDKSRVIHRDNEIIQTDNNETLSKQITEIIPVDNDVIQTDNQCYPYGVPQNKTTCSIDTITKDITHNCVDAESQNSNSKPVAKQKKAAKPKAELNYSSWPSMPSDQVMADWVALRKQKRSPISQTVVNQFGKQFVEAARHGFSVEDCLAECVMRGWSGFKCEWLLNRQKPNNAPVNQTDDLDWDSTDWANSFSMQGGF